MTEQDEVEEYTPKWANSSNQNGAYDNGDKDDDFREYNAEEGDDASSIDDHIASVDELPPFSDEESKALHREIKLLEQRRDEAAKSARAHKYRIGIINDHLHSVRQEIDHTNSLVAAKKSEVETEGHLLSLAQREIGQSQRDISSLENDIATKQSKIHTCQSSVIVAEEELEKLKTDLNWNQEELEQWATAATKKEEENLALQKYTLADELKIKELTLTIEDLTKISVEKKSMLDNEVTETRSNQTELEKLAERFKNRHDERRQLIKQWKDTIESMNNRDESVNVLAAHYAELAQREDEGREVIIINREQYELLQVRHMVLILYSVPLNIYSYYMCNLRMKETTHNKTLVPKNVTFKPNVKTYRRFRLQRAHCSWK